MKTIEKMVKNYVGGEKLVWRSFGASGILDRQIRMIPSDLRSRLNNEIIWRVDEWEMRLYEGSWIEMIDGRDRRM